MLVLSRRVGESILIGDEISVSVLSVNGMHVKIGITAPEDVVVHREEIYRRIAEENRRAVSMASAANTHTLTQFGGQT